MPRTRRTYESPALGSASLRMARALVRRAEDGDTEALEELLKLDAAMTTLVADAGRGLRAKGYSLHELSRVTGTSRAACSKRFGPVA